jgi:hypothetical protein
MEILRARMVGIRTERERLERLYELKHLEEATRKAPEEVERDG